MEMVNNSTSDGITSTFNEASLKMMRIHENQKIINRLRPNMLLWIAEYNKYAYQVVIAELMSLMMEVFGKMSVAQKKDAKKFRGYLTTVLELLPVYQYNITKSITGEHNNKSINIKNWTTTKELIFAVEDFIQANLEEHGYTSPSMDDKEDWE